MSYLSRLLRQELVELDPSELELSPEELQPAPLTGASVEKATAATENSILKLRERRETIAQEIERLNGELRQTDTVLKSQEAALAAIDGMQPVGWSTPLPTKMAATSVAVLNEGRS